MALVTFGLGITTVPGLGGQRETMGDNGFGNFRAGNHHWGRLGRQRETMGDNGFGNFWAGEDHWDRLGRQRETMGDNGFGNFWAGNQGTGAGSGDNARQWETMGSVTFRLAIRALGQAREAMGGNGFGGFREITLGLIITSAILNRVR